eukprot:5116574-Ditylum_brightwellii.AAC.1
MMPTDEPMNEPIIPSATNLERSSNRTKPGVFISKGDNVRKTGKEEKRQSDSQTTNPIMPMLAQ